MNILNSIKSKYIQKEIFKFLSKYKYFKIIQHNKNLQVKLQLDIDDYIEYYKSIPKIEIKLLISNNLLYDDNNIFIVYKGDASYYHIYFDDKKEEILRNYLTNSDKVKAIKILIDNEIKSLSTLFRWCRCIKEISFTKFKI